MGNLLVALVLCGGVAVYAAFLFVAKRRLQLKFSQVEEAVSDVNNQLRDAKTQLSEAKALFDLSQEENRDLKTRLDKFVPLVAEKDVAIAERDASLELISRNLSQREEELSGVQNQLAFEQEQYKKLIGQKKSSEVRVGKITEQISPFLENYPLDPKNARFLGDPLDFVSFDEDKITFVEVKSGKSQLNKRQRHFRDLINGGKVEFLLYRISGGEV